jgi:hypothetical protein
MNNLVSLGGWASIGLWLIADRALHGGVRADHLLASVAILGLGPLVDRALKRLAWRRSPRPRVTARVASIGNALASALLIAAIVLVASGLEIAFRVRQDDSAVVLIASLLVHGAGTTIFVTSITCRGLLEMLSAREPPE